MRFFVPIISGPRMTKDLVASELDSDLCSPPKRRAVGSETEWYQGNLCPAL